MSRRLTDAEVASFDQDGFLIVRDLLTAEETVALKRWAQEVHDLPTDVDSPWMPYAEINAHGEHVLCRTGLCAVQSRTFLRRLSDNVRAENFAESHTGLNGLLRGMKVLGLLRELSGEDMLLFKEKINYKLAGSGGFAVSHELLYAREFPLNCEGAHRQHSLYPRQKDSASGRQHCC